MFSAEELELLISGTPSLDVDDWQSHTHYSGYSSDENEIVWFWSIVREASEDERVKLLQFVTGTSRIPHEGFSHLQGINGIQEFQIHEAMGDSGLPTAHTCFNTLDLPRYSSKAQMKKMLLLAVNEGWQGFGFA